MLNPANITVGDKMDGLGYEDLASLLWADQCLIALYMCVILFLNSINVKGLTRSPAGLVLAGPEVLYARQKLNKWR